MQDKFKPPSQKEKKKYARYLAPDEKILVVTGISNVYFWSQLTRLAIPALLIFGIPALTRLIRKKQSFHYVLTNKRCLIVQGIFARKLITAPLSAITHITVEQSFQERFFYHCGHIVVITAGYDPREIVIENVSHPVEFKILMEQLQARLDTKGSAEGDPRSKKVEEKPQVEEISSDTPVVSKPGLKHLKLAK